MIQWVQHPPCKVTNDGKSCIRRREACVMMQYPTNARSQCYMTQRLPYPTVEISSDAVLQVYASMLDHQQPHNPTICWMVPFGSAGEDGQAVHDSGSHSGLLPPASGPLAGAHPSPGHQFLSRQRAILHPHSHQLGQRPP